MDDITTISAVIASVSVVVGVIFTILEIRHMTRTRRTEVILKIYERFGSKEIVEAVMKIGEFKNYDDYVKKFGVTDTVQVLEIFDEVGILLEEGLVDLDLVEDLFSPSVTPEWESNILALITGLRQVSKQPSFFSHVEYLFSRLRTNKK